MNPHQAAVILWTLAGLTGECILLEFIFSLCRVAKQADRRAGEILAVYYGGSGEPASLISEELKKPKAQKGI